GHDGVALAKVSIPGEAPPRLPHEPDWGSVRHFPSQGRKESPLAGHALDGHRDHQLSLSDANPRRAAATVALMSSSSWAAEINHASCWDGGSMTPSSSIAWKKRAKRASSSKKRVSKEAT